MAGRPNHQFALTLKGRITGRAGPHRGEDLAGIVGVPPTTPILLLLLLRFKTSSSWMLGVLPVLTTWHVGGQAAQPGPARTSSPPVQRGGAGVRLTALLGGDARHVGYCYIVTLGTGTRARQSNCSETLKASGTAMGWRHPTSTMW